jgi:hypothetical protein
MKLDKILRLYSNLFLKRFALITEALNSSEDVNFYLTTRRNIPEGSHLGTSLFQASVKLVEHDTL